MDAAVDAAVDAEQSQEIAAGGKWSTGVVVPDEGANVSWVWRTVSGQDLSFEVQWMPTATGASAEVVVTSARSDEDGNPIIGHYEASGGGVLRLEWSNEHSWMTGKELRWQVITTAEGGGTAAVGGGAAAEAGGAWEARAAALSATPEPEPLAQ